MTSYDYAGGSRIRQAENAIKGAGRTGVGINKHGWIGGGRVGVDGGPTGSEVAGNLDDISEPDVRRVTEAEMTRRRNHRGGEDQRAGVNDVDGDGIRGGQTAIGGGNGGERISGGRQIIHRNRERR